MAHTVFYYPMLQALGSLVSWPVYGSKWNRTRSHMLRLLKAIEWVSSSSVAIGKTTEDAGAHKLTFKDRRYLSTRPEL